MLAGAYSLICAIIFVSLDVDVAFTEASRRWIIYSSVYSAMRHLPKEKKLLMIIHICFNSLFWCWMLTYLGKF